MISFNSRVTGTKKIARQEHSTDKMYNPSLLTVTNQSTDHLSPLTFILATEVHKKDSPESNLIWSNHFTIRTNGLSMTQNGGLVSQGIRVWEPFGPQLFRIFHPVFVLNIEFVQRFSLWEVELCFPIKLTLTFLFPYHYSPVLHRSLISLAEPQNYKAHLLFLFQSNIVDPSHAFSFFKFEIVSLNLSLVCQNIIQLIQI